MLPSSWVVFLNVNPPELPWPVYHWASTLSARVESVPPSEAFLKSRSQALVPRQSNAVVMPCEAITFLKPIAESCAHCHSSTVCSMPTSVGPMASLPKPPPPGVDSTETLPSPSRCADAVAVMPLASVTSTVTVSPFVSGSRGSRLYSMCGSPTAGSTVDEDDHLYVYGAVPPDAFT